jgi:hypothetical protein
VIDPVPVFHLDWHFVLILCVCMTSHVIVLILCVCVTSHVIVLILCVCVTSHVIVLILCCVYDKSCDCFNSCVCVTSHVIVLIIALFSVIYQDMSTQQVYDFVGFKGVCSKANLGIVYMY